MPILTYMKPRAITLGYRLPVQNKIQARKFTFTPGVPKTVSEADFANLCKIKLFDRELQEGSFTLSGIEKVKAKETKVEEPKVEEVENSDTEDAGTEEPKKRGRKKKIDIID